MGQQGCAQDELFYSFDLGAHVPPITCCAASIVFSTSAIYVAASRPSTVTPAGPRSIRN